MICTLWRRICWAPLQERQRQSITTYNSQTQVVAKSYRAIAVAFSGGLDALPQHVLLMSVICGGTAIVNNAVCEWILAPRGLESYAPHSAAVGIGLYVMQAWLSACVACTSTCLACMRMHQSSTYMLVHHV